MISPNNVVIKYTDSSVTSQSGMTPAVLYYAFEQTTGILTPYTDVQNYVSNKLRHAGIILDNGLYQIKDNSVYPVSHPDLSTQPSILPQRFGNLDIQEVLIANGREYEIPSDAIVLEAFSFNKTECAPAIVRKNAKVVQIDGNSVNDVSIAEWSISNPVGIIPDFTIVRYVTVSTDKGYYYDNYDEYGEDEPEHILFEFTSDERHVVYGKGSTITQEMVESAIGSDIVREIVVYPTVSSIEEYAFSNLTVYGIYLPNTITSIGDYAFAVMQDSGVIPIYIYSETPPTIHDRTFYTTSYKIYVPQDYYDNYVHRTDEWAEIADNIYQTTEPYPVSE